MLGKAPTASQEAPASPWSSLLAGVAVVVAIALVGMAAYLAVHRTVSEEVPIDRNFATESGTLPNGRR